MHVAVLLRVGLIRSHLVVGGGVVSSGQRLPFWYESKKQVFAERDWAGTTGIAHPSFCFERWVTVYETRLRCSCAVCLAALACCMHH